MSFTSPLPSLNPIFLPFPPIHMLLIHPSFHSSLHPSPRPCVVSYPALSGRSLYPSYFLPLHLSPSATLLLPLITPSCRSFSLSACPHVFFSPRCRPDRSLSDDRGHGCLSLLSLSARSFSQFIYHPPCRRAPCDGSVSASSSCCPLMSPCAHLLPRHHARDVLISPVHGCRGSPRCALSLLYRCTPICQRVAFSGRVGLP